MKKRIVIAIDGFSSCGKSTMAKELARSIGYVYVDSGAMYRAVTLFALREGLFSADGQIDEAALARRFADVSVSFSLDPQTGRPITCLNGECVERYIRTMEVSSRVSLIAALPFVRRKLVQMQQDLGEAKGIVMDGRDIGTAVFPDAELKVFVTASAEVRAERRFDELTAKGEAVSYDEILQNVQERDYIDTHRAVDPLRRAADALELDNSRLTREEQSAWLLAQYEKAAGE